MGGSKWFDSAFAGYVFFPRLTDSSLGRSHAHDYLKSVDTGKHITACA